MGITTGKRSIINQAPAEAMEAKSEPNPVPFGSVVLHEFRRQHLAPSRSTPPPASPIPTPVRVLRVILVLGAILHLTGGHWGVLQCVAWTKMIVDYSAQDGWLEGTRKTFGGEHPCAMCKSIAAAKQEEHREPEQAPARVRDLAFKDLTLPASSQLSRPRLNEVAFVTSPGPLLPPIRRSERPPLPPPRHLA